MIFTKEIDRVIILLIMLVMFVSVCFAEQIDFQHDANGNLITGDGYYREFNGLNQLARIRLGNNASAPLIYEFTHDPLEERVVIKKEYNPDSSIKETTYYFSEEFVRVINDSGTYDYTYVFLEGQLIAQINPDGSKTFFHGDHIGSTSVVTNEAEEVIENTSYEPFGNIIEGGDASRYDFTGQEFDDALGDYDYNARRYDPDIAMFTQPDTLISNIYEPKNLNHYSYVHNNPYKYTDPNGRDLIVANNPSGAFGFGHTYAFVGNVDTGYTRIELSGVNTMNPPRGNIYVEPLGRDENGQVINYEIAPGERSFTYMTTDEEDEMMVEEAKRIRDKKPIYIPGIADCDKLIVSVASSSTNANYRSYNPFPTINFMQNIQQVINELGGNGYVSGFGYVTEDGRFYPSTNPNWKPTLNGGSRSSGSTSKSSSRNYYSKSGSSRSYFKSGGREYRV